MIPVKQTKFKTESTGGNCLAACFASILEVSLNEIPCFDLYGKYKWSHAMLAWLESKSLDIEVCSSRMPPSGFSIAGGQSPRGDYKHAVVALQGKLSHDPHPSFDGLTKIDYFWEIVKLKSED